ncbi:DUF2497 domain-containing protein [Altererythrobacter sp. H2]|uniref:DUF2497 domain-containing protein n=1 Tax=Altererythrobacter sp. H2 TaxID=3108391 RepID=UPI000BCC78EB|nr:DUF2497 domain-containing protein [Altererythrobacter sp. H2]OZA94003.1 MAG: hypothetical protein B7X57_03015 [Erythrobacter sp. 34-65-8]WRK96071.1 DUF2497 domain-containing protein [Altererythrobacter sp. H2]
MSQHGEASVEEILESIKKVIARDNRVGALEERRRRETQGIIAPATKGDAKGDDAEEVLELGEDDLAAEHDPSTPAEDDSPLIAESVRDSMRENLAALAMIAEPGVPPQIVRSGETSLEGLVREMLRPMLAQWLDTHLPGMVETMVKAEISRIAGKRG